MKALLFFFLSLFCLQQCEAQRAVVANLKMNIVFIGYPNPLDILVESYKCSTLKVSTNNGSITKGEDACNYIHIPERQGVSEIIIRTNEGRIIYKTEFRAKFIEGVPVASLCGRERGALNVDSKGTIYIYDLLSCSQIDAHINGPDWDAGFRVKNYSVSIIKNGDTTFTQKDIVGNLFPENLKQRFKSIGHGSKLLFYGIKAQGPDKRILELSPLEFTITKK